MVRAIVAVLMLAVVFGAGSPSFAITAQDEAVRIARDAAEKEGVVAGEADIIYDPLNKRWEERVVAIGKLPNDPNHGKLPHGALYNKKYVTVLLDFKEGAKDADTWVFLDEDTNDVITIYQENR